jgi:hypothetical protein
MRSIVKWVLAVLPLALLGTSCRTQTASDAPEEIKQAFVALEGAMAVSRSEDSLTYRVREAYPAVKAISEIDASLKARGWTPVAEDVMNPGSPTSIPTDGMVGAAS